MESTDSPLVIGKEGLRGRLLTEPQGVHTQGATALVELENGQKMQVPVSALIKQADGAYHVALSQEDVNRAQASRTEHASRRETALVVPVYQEELAVDKRTVEIGRARITKHVEEHEEVVDEPLLRQEVQIDYVPINRIWDGPPPPPRYEADKLIIPLLEEVLVVEKRLMLKEELHISRVQKTVREPQSVVLRSESVSVERVEPESDTERRGAAQP